MAKQNTSTTPPATLEEALKVIADTQASLDQVTSDYNKDIETFAGQKTEFKEANDKLVEENNTLKSTNEKLKSKNDELLEENDSLEEELEESAKTIAELSKLKDAAEAKANGGILVKVDGVAYQFVHPKFRFEGKDYTSKDASENEALCKELVSQGYGGLKLVTN